MSENESDIFDEYEQGWQAKLGGFTTAACPYESDTPEAVTWLNGWEDAEAKP